LRRALVGQHVTPEEMEKVLGGGLPAGRLQEVVRHLLRGCKTCREEVRQSTLVQAQGKRPAPAAYDAAFESAFDFARRLERLPFDERPRFQRALSLLSSGHDVFALTWEGDMPLSGLGVFEALLARSWAVRYKSPAQMCHLARVAAEMARSFEPRLYGGPQVADLQARAWGELANAYRVADKLHEAQNAFGWAFSCLENGTGNPLLKARLLDLKASWWGTRRHFEMALRTLEIVPALYREAGDDHLAGRTLITKALYTFYSGDATEAIFLNQQGRALIDEEREPTLVSFAVYNDILYMIEKECFEPAERLLFRNRARFQSFDAVNSVKLRWVEGRINYGLKRFPSAEIAFRAVIEGFDAHGKQFHRALASLELAMTLLRQSRYDEAQIEVLTAHQVFAALEIHREVLASTVLLKEAFRLRNISLKLLEEVVKYLRRKQIELGL
jgi:tetratricopeptide (TPR) repeat protein